MVVVGDGMPVGQMVVLVVEVEVDDVLVEVG